MKRKNAINKRSSSVGWGWQASRLSLSLSLSVYLHLYLHFLHCFVPLGHCIWRFLCRRNSLSSGRGSFFFLCLLPPPPALPLWPKLIENFPLHWTWKRWQFPSWHWAKLGEKFPQFFHSNFVINLWPWVLTNFVRIDLKPAYHCCKYEQSYK